MFTIEIDNGYGWLEYSIFARMRDHQQSSTAWIILKNLKFDGFLKIKFRLLKDGIQIDEI